MIIPIPKSTMLNHNYIAGLLLFFILTTGDVFAESTITSNTSNNANSVHSYKNSNSMSNGSVNHTPNKTLVNKASVSSKTLDSINSLHKEISPAPGQNIPILIPQDKNASGIKNRVQENKAKGQKTEHLSFAPFFDGRLYKAYIPDGVKFLSSKESFIKLGVDLNQTALFIRQVGEQFDAVFKDEILDQTQENKLIVIKVRISSDFKNKNCDINCVLVKKSFHSQDKFGDEIITFSKKVRELNNINISHPESSEIAEFQIYLNTKPKNFIVKTPFNKLPTSEMSPFANIG